MERDNPAITRSSGVKAADEIHDPTANSGAALGDGFGGDGFSGAHGVPVVTPAAARRRPRTGQQFVPTVFYGSIWLILALFIALVVLALYFPADLGKPADPLNKSFFIPRPEWYFLSLFQILKIFQGPWELVGTVVIPGIFTVILLGLPFYDRNWFKRPGRRPLAMTLVSAVMVVLLLLTWQSEGSPLPFTGGGATAAPPAGGTGGGSAAAPTWASVAYPIFQANCAACHFSGGSAVSILDLSKYDSLFASSHPGGPVQGPLVVKGDHTKSYLWDVLAGQNLQGGAQMPLGGAPLPQQSIQALADWIDKGAAK